MKKSLYVGIKFLHSLYFRSPNYIAILFEAMTLTMKFNVKFGEFIFNRKENLFL